MALMGKAVGYSNPCLEMASVAAHYAMDGQTMDRSNGKRCTYLGKGILPNYGWISF